MLVSYLETYAYSFSTASLHSQIVPVNVGMKWRGSEFGLEYVRI